MTNLHVRNSLPSLYELQTSNFELQFSYLLVSSFARVLQGMKLPLPMNPCTHDGMCWVDKARDIPT